MGLFGPFLIGVLLYMLFYHVLFSCLLGVLCVLCVLCVLSFVATCIDICTYICRERERERERALSLSLYIHMCVYIYIYMLYTKTSCYFMSSQGQGVAHAADPAGVLFQLYLSYVSFGCLLCVITCFMFVLFRFFALHIYIYIYTHNQHLCLVSTFGNVFRNICFTSSQDKGVAHGADPVGVPFGDVCKEGDPFFQICFQCTCCFLSFLCVCSFYVFPVVVCFCRFCASMFGSCGCPRR